MAGCITSYVVRSTRNQDVLRNICLDVTAQVAEQQIGSSPRAATN